MDDVSASQTGFGATRAKRFLQLVAILALGWLGACAESQPRTVDAKQFLPLIEFVERETDYLLYPWPQFQIVPRDQRRALPTASEAALRAYSEYRVIKWQENGRWVHSGVVTLDEQWSTDVDVLQKAVLIANLVHHGQFIAIVRALNQGDAYDELLRSKGWVCLNSLKGESARAQNLWLFRNRADRRVSQSRIEEVSRCEPGSAPVKDLLDHAPVVAAGRR